MLDHVRTVDRRLFTRRCVSCGFEGTAINRPQRHRCPRCGCNLGQRPPRSYAEMEGLLGTPVLVRDRSEQPRRQRSGNDSLLQRWLAFLFLAMLGLMAIVYLSAAAIPM